MAGYIGNKSSVVSSGAERKFKFTITETTTTLSNLAYTRDLVHVFHNGVRLVDGTDYTATNGTSITLTNAAEDGDEVVVISYASFQPSDTVSASLGGTFEGNITVNADLTVSGNTDINGGTIDGTVIGGSTPAAISGTTGTFSGNLTVDTNTLFVDSANNRVGVGTTSPVSLLDIANPSGFSNRVIHVTGDINPTGYDASTSGARVGFTYGTAEVAGIRSGVTNGTGGAETSRLVFSTANSGVLSEKLRIEANGAVGIGTSSPSFPMHVSTSTFPGVGIFRALDVGTIGAASQEIQIGALDGSTPTPGASIIGVLNNPATTGTLSFQTRSGGALSERMRIDSAGRVTKPYQPAFHAIRTSHVTSSGTIVFESKTFDVGNNYNNTTGIFTAPVAGKYLITFSALLWNMDSASSVQLRINGSPLASAFGTYGYFTGTYAGQGASAVISLNAADYVTMYFTHYGTNLHSNYTWWSGCLLG